MLNAYKCLKCGDLTTTTCCDFAEVRQEMKEYIEELEQQNKSMLNEIKMWQSEINEFERLNTNYRQALNLILNNSLGNSFSEDVANRALHPEQYCNNCEARLTPDDEGAKCENCGR